MRKLTRRKFIQIVGAASTVMAAGLLTGCGDADGGNASGGVSGGSSQEGADTESPSGGAGEPDGSGASDTEIGVVWKEVPLSKTTCDFNGLEFTAKTQEMVLNDYRQDIETGTYVWRGDNVLGVMAYVENKRSQKAAICIKDCTATVDGTPVDYRNISIAVHGDTIENLFEKGDPLTLQPGEFNSGVLVFNIPSKTMYLNWKEMKVTVQVDDEKVVYTVKKGKTLFDSTISAVKMVKA